MQATDGLPDAAISSFTAAVYEPSVWLSSISTFSAGGCAETLQGILPWSSSSCSQLNQAEFLAALLRSGSRGCKPIWMRIIWLYVCIYNVICIYYIYIYSIYCICIYLVPPFWCPLPTALSYNRQPLAVLPLGAAFFLGTSIYTACVGGAQNAAIEMFGLVVTGSYGLTVSDLWKKDWDSNSESARCGSKYSSRKSYVLQHPVLRNQNMQGLHHFTVETTSLVAHSQVDVPKDHLSAKV